MERSNTGPRAGLSGVRVVVLGSGRSAVRHDVAQGTAADVPGVTQPLSGEDAREALAAWGVPATLVEEWATTGAITDKEYPR